MTKLRFGILATHPIQYQAPLFRRLAADPRIDLKIYFCHDHGVRPSLDPQFGKVFQYDVPLLDGYAHEFLPNVHPKPTVEASHLINPRITNVLRSGMHDALLVQGYNYATSILSLLGPHGRTRLLFRGESNLTLARSATKRAAKHLFLRTAFRRVRQFLSIGRLNSDYYASYGVESSRITIAPYSVDNDYFAERSRAARENPKEARIRLGLPQDGLLFLFVAKLIPKKRPLDAIHAFASLPRDLNANLAIVGDGALRSEVEAEIAKSPSRERIHLLGFRNQSELPEIYGASDVLVLPSDLETWGLVVNEAMASGMIAICSDQIGSAPDLVDRSCIYPTGNVELLAAIMKHVASDHEHLARLRSEARERIAHWGLRETAEGFIAGAMRAVS